MQLEFHQGSIDLLGKVSLNQAAVDDSLVA